MNSANKITLGAFVIVSITLIIGAFLAVGVGKMFESTYQAMTVMNTSVEGLTVGSAVKFMGVPVGRVTRIAMRNVDGYIDVYFDIFASSIDIINDGKPASAQPANLIEVMRRKQLACFLNASGIMSSAHLELTMNDSEQLALPNLRVTEPNGVLYIPSRTSHVTNVIQNISIMLDELTKVDVVKLTDKLNNTLDNANEVFANKDLKEMIIRLNRVSQDVEQCARNLQLAFAEENVQKIINAINYLEESLGKVHDAFPKERVDALAINLNDFMQESTQFLQQTNEGRDVLVKDIGELKIRAMLSLTRFDNAMRDLMQFLNQLEDDPNQFIRGRQVTPVFGSSQPGDKK